MKFLLSIYNLETLKRCGDVIDSALLMVPNYSMIYEEDFDIDEAIKICESSNIEAILSISRIFMENELEEIKSFILKYQNHNFLVSDLGVIQIFKELNLMNHVIYDSSTMVCNSLDLTVYSKLGLLATSMSNEIPISDVIKGYKDTNADIMYLVFGRKQMFYSKRRLISCYEDHRGISLARNDLYIKEEKRIEHMPIVENKNGFFVYRSYFISLLKEMQNLSFLKYAYFESLTLNIEVLTEILRIFKGFSIQNMPLEAAIEKLDLLGLDIQDGFSYSDTIHVKEKIINEKN